MKTTEDFTEEEILSIFDSVKNIAVERRTSNKESKGRKRPPIVDPEEREDAPSKRAYQATVVKRLRRQGWFTGTLRTNMNASDEHVANIVLRVHHSEITNYAPVNKNIEGYIYDDTWSLMVQIVRETRQVLQLPGVQCEDEKKHDHMECEFESDLEPRFRRRW